MHSCYVIVMKVKYLLKPSLQTHSWWIPYVAAFCDSCWAAGSLLLSLSRVARATEEREKEAHHQPTLHHSSTIDTPPPSLSSFLPFAGVVVVEVDDGVGVGYNGMLFLMVKSGRLSSQLFTTGTRSLFLKVKDIRHPFCVLEFKAEGIT